MFILKFHKPKCKTMYSGGDKLVANKQYAIAFGEAFREMYEKFADEHEYCSLVTINVSDMAEMMYRNTAIKCNKIAW